jgi:hypothetical protein
MYISPKQLFKKGTNVFVYNIFVDGIGGQEKREFDLTVGVDILQSDDEYVNQNGELFVTYKQIDNAIIDYVVENYPEAYDFMFEI